MKYFCEACERLVPPAAFRVEFGLLVVKCSRCKVEMRCGPDQEEAPAPAPASKSAGGPVIMLGESDAEPDPIENEPTRRVAVPAAVLAAIEAEAREARRKKTKESEAAKSSPTPEPEPVKAAASEPAAKTSTSPKLAMSEAAAASNLMVLRLSEVKPRAAQEPTPPPVPAEPASARAASAQLRVVPDAPPAPTPAPAASSTPEDPFMPPSGYCPKCIGPRKDGAAVCPFCGLEYARFRADEFRPSPVLSSTWLGVQELWESKGAHDKVLALASERGELAGLGRLYRIRLARNPEDAPAKRGREEVLRLASAGSAFMPTPPPDKRTKMRMAGLGLLFLVLLVAAVLIGAQVRRMLMGGGGP
ncbi:hypothetical protein [Vitiosangium sp. GDMCC 1.1324]|uniref:hypothetical protein n=1 Tax=Vitiosangium sp. (strain GDMCC 1.1324) TaxID=2138576 RepID=UPI000D3AF19E|nr:hypothetical protein [Vitiosangium sp. GDMCC 1.1324]PTL82949.1 hypothetical protein DAT35_13045 [Vitiosangium sp. GDMCC 1.1324]